MAFMAKLNEPHVTRDIYEQVRAEIGWDHDPPAGCLLHIAAFDEAGAHTVGYTCATFERAFQPNPWVVEERKTRVLSARIQRLAEESDAFVVVHGGLGTLAELALVWNMMLAGELAAKPLVVVGRAWPKVIDVVHAETQTGSSALRLLTLVQTPQQAVERLRELLATLMPSR